MYDQDLSEVVEIMIKVLDSTKSLTTLVSDTTNGLGQINVLNDSVTEELNGQYELEFDILTNDKHYDDLVNNRLVKVNVDETGDEQIFRVYEISPAINFVSHVKCQHISYDLLKIAVKPFTATGAVNAKNGMLSNMIGPYPFTMTTDITNTTSTFTLDIPRSFRECLGGYEGSLLDVFRGEYKWDNLTVNMLAARGSDHGTRIAYGKNLTDFKQEENNENVFDAVYGYAVIDDVTYQASSIYNKTGASQPKVKCVDFSSDYESGQTPTAAQLLSKATAYANNNDIEIPNVNIKVSFVPLWQTEEYKDVAPLERVFLGDTVHVYFDKLGVEASARVIKTKWSPSLKRYTEMELGDAKSTLNSIIDTKVGEALTQADKDMGFISSRLNLMSELIVNGLGLHISQDSAGRIKLHNAETISASNVQYMISDQGFIVSTDYGQTWNAGFDVYGNAVLNSLATITLNALEVNGSTINGSVINGTTINFGDLNNKYMSAGTNGYGIQFNGNGQYRIATVGNIEIENTDGDNRRNSITMTNTSTQNYLSLYNWLRGNVGQNNKANMMQMYSLDTANQTSIIVYDDNMQERAVFSGTIWNSTATGSVSNNIGMSLRDSSGNYIGTISINDDRISIRSENPINIYSESSVSINGHQLTFSGGNVGYQ